MSKTPSNPKLTSGNEDQSELFKPIEKLKLDPMDGFKKHLKQARKNILHSLKNLGIALLCGLTAAYGVGKAAESLYQHYTDYNPADASDTPDTNNRKNLNENNDSQSEKNQKNPGTFEQIANKITDSNSINEKFKQILTSAAQWSDSLVNSTKKSAESTLNELKTITNKLYLVLTGMQQQALKLGNDISFWGSFVLTFLFTLKIIRRILTWMDNNCSDVDPIVKKDIQLLEETINQMIKRMNEQQKEIQALKSQNKISPEKEFDLALKMGELTKEFQEGVAAPLQNITGKKDKNKDGNFDFDDEDLE